MTGKRLLVTLGCCLVTIGLCGISATGIYLGITGQEMNVVPKEIIGWHSHMMGLGLLLGFCGLIYEYIRLAKKLKNIATGLLVSGSFLMPQAILLKMATLEAGKLAGVFGIAVTIAMLIFAIGLMRWRE